MSLFLNIFYLFFFFCFLYILNEYLIKKKILISNTKELLHRTFIQNAKNTPISGGLFILILFFIFNNQLSLINFIFIFIIFFIGLIADFKKNFKPSVRLVVQAITIFLFVFFNKLLISDVRIIYLNQFLEYKIIGYIFVVFSILVFLNGTNLIDGINNLSIGYFLLIFLSTLYILFKININYHFFLIILIASLIFLIVLNSFNKLYLGDSGCYLLSFFSSITLIALVEENKLISPYYVVLVFWYPCFENLFTFFRRMFSKQPISKPDNLHLHHLVYSFLNNKSKNLAARYILSFQSIIFFFGTINFNNTKVLIFLIVISISIYIFFYAYLRNLLKKNF